MNAPDKGSSWFLTSSLPSLGEAARDLGRERDPFQAVWKLICNLREQVGLDRAGVYAYDPFTQVMEHIAGVDRNGKAEFSGRSFPLDGEPLPIKLIGRREVPYYYSSDVRSEYPKFPWAPGVRSHAIVPIIAGDELLGALAVDNCLSGKVVPSEILEPLHLYAALAALPLFALFHQKQEERLDAMRRRIHRDVLLAVTCGKVRLCELDEIEGEWPPSEDAISVQAEHNVRDVRVAAQEAAMQLGMESDRAADFGLCASEAVTNALLHGGGGTATLGMRDARVRLRVRDFGVGINPDDLPKATLLRGWSSRASMGLGFTVMSEIADRVLLHTGPHGTTVIIEMGVEAPTDPRALLHGALQDGDLLMGQMF